MIKKHRVVQNVVNLSFLISILALSACNGGNQTLNTNSVVTPITPPVNPNLTIYISSGSNGLCNNVNIPCVTVTVCNPETPSVCDTVSNVLIDSGSYGLRVFRSALPNTGNTLPNETSGGQTVAECINYADFAANWGPVAWANITLGSQSTTESVPMQIIDASFVGSESRCPNADTQPTPADFGFNGVLGVGPLIPDGGNYYTCSSNTCNPFTPTSPVSNPIAYLAESYNNGITFKLPAIGSSGAIGAIGYAIFGVATNSDNALANGTATYAIAESDQGIPIRMNTSSITIPGLNFGFLDSGSNGLYFDDNNITTCSDLNNEFYCPPDTLALSAINTSESGGITTNFNIANTDALLNNTGNTSFNNLGGPLGYSGFLDYGLPFFFGKTVYICFDGATCNGVSVSPAWVF